LEILWVSSRRPRGTYVRESMGYKGIPNWNKRNKNMLTFVHKVPKT